MRLVIALIKDNRECIVSIPLRGIVKCDFTLIYFIYDYVDFVSIPLRGIVKCDYEEGLGIPYLLEVSIPLRGIVKCDKI